MPNALDIHPASHDEVIAAHSNVFDIWSKGFPLQEHIRHRLESPSHRRATWFVGCLEVRVVVSLGCYPLSLCLQGHQMPGIGIGSVYTLAEFRGRRFARQLLNWVEEFHRKRYTALSILYSDINPRYYSRLGYIKCPSHVGWHDFPNRAVPSPTEANSMKLPAATVLTQVMPYRHRRELSMLYATYHGAWPLSIARREDYRLAMQQRFPDDEYFAMIEVDGSWSAYVRLSNKSQTWRMTDWGLRDQSTALAERFYEAVIRLARDRGADRVGGWLPNTPTVRKHFTVSPRGTEITMIKPLTWPGEITRELIAGIDHFREIDHV